MERAAARFWGTLTLGAHCNGYVADARGRPAQLWIARRAPTKATDPNRLDNLIGGGVPAGQSPRDTVVREGWEEAGLQPEQMRGLQRGRVLRLLRDIPEGLQREWIHVYDLALPPGAVPRNQDGEVAELALHEIGPALALAASGEMTVDAALVTLDFALRHRLFDAATQGTLDTAAAGLWMGAAA
jgi:8-oxo-dGTP pyrophosphatase MutT (NUDIX family)